MYQTHKKAVPPPQTEQKRRDGHLSPGARGPATIGLHDIQASSVGRIGPLVSLQAQATHHAGVQQLMQLQQTADDQKAKGPIPVRIADRRRAAPAGQAADQHGRTNLRNTTQLQRQMPTFGAVQYPALIGARNTPLVTPFTEQMGAAVTQMARADYDAWRGSPTGRALPHGVLHQGDRSTVARFGHGTPVAQRFSIPLTQKMKAGLVMAEASLTIIAGLVGLGAGVGFGAVPLVVPSILALITGAVKLGRGVLMYQEKAPEGTRLAVIDTLRTIEALVAGAGALLADPTSFYKIPAMIFAIAKLVRSLATALADLIDTKSGKKPSIFVKGLRALSAVAHAVEVATIGFSSGAGIVDGIGGIAEGGEALAGGIARTAAGVTGLGIGAAKDIRTVDQFVGLGKKPAPQQDGAVIQAPVVEPQNLGRPENVQGPDPVVVPADGPEPAVILADGPEPEPTREENEISYAKQIAYGKSVASIYDWSDQTVYEMAIAGSFDENVRAIDADTAPTPSYFN